MGDILKEAIADAKAVRETALANAKMALEEAFTPQLKSMLSAKLREDEDDTEEGYMEDEMEMPAEEDEEMGDEAPEEMSYEDEDMSDEVPAEEMEEPEEMAHEEDEEMGDEVPEEDEDNLDLEAIIRELEDELSEGEDDDEDTVDEQDDAYDSKAGAKRDGLAEQDDDDDEEVEVDESLFKEEDDAYDEDVENLEKSEHKSDVFKNEQSDTSKIGSGDNAVDVADENDEEDPEESTAVYSEGSFHKVKAQLKEYKEAVHFLKDKLHEVNILNAKLLFTNKLFKSYSLDNNQKLKVVETFDRAQTTREIKLVYSTLAEQFQDNGSIVTRKSIKESASTAVGSTKPSKGSRKVISEETQVANRFKKLAGIIK